MAKGDTNLATASKKQDTLALRGDKAPKLSFGEVAKELYDAGDLVSGEDYGNGFTILDKSEKGRLVGVPFIILDWSINEGDFGPFVSLKLVTQANEYLILNDGGTGIAKQIDEMAGKGETKAVHIKKGLRKSDYEYKDKDGSMKPATTFYLDI